MFLVSNSFQVAALILLVELAVWLKRVTVLTSGIEGRCQRVTDVGNETLQVSVVIKHGGEAWTLAARLFFKLVVDYRSAIYCLMLAIRLVRHYCRVRENIHVAIGVIRMG